ncbi:hypothetical protein JFY74_08390 [Pectobacterium carotovorum]|nr:hypothetical protein JFY74_08390 [Pectobacterium carotovorum]
MKIMMINASFDDLHIRKSTSSSEHQTFWQNILSFDGYPEYGIRLSLSFDDHVKSNYCISHEEEEALGNYIADSWEYINKYLTPNPPLYSIHSLERKTTLERLVNKMPTSELDFYRAVRTDGRCFFSTLIDKLEKKMIETGNILINYSFLSFTNNPYSLRAFFGDTANGEVENNCILYKLTGGIKSISKISPVDEFEGIVPPGSLLEVEHARKLNIKIKSGHVRNIWFIEIKKAPLSSKPHFDFYGNAV